jgi:hypothetical protein
LQLKHTLLGLQVLIGKPLWLAKGCMNEFHGGSFSWARSPRYAGVVDFEIYRAWDEVRECIVSVKVCTCTATQLPMRKRHELLQFSLTSSSILLTVFSGFKHDCVEFSLLPLLVEPQQAKLWEENPQFLSIFTCFD